MTPAIAAATELSARLAQPFMGAPAEHATQMRQAAEAIAAKHGVTVEALRRAMAPDWGN